MVTKDRVPSELSSPRQSTEFSKFGSVRIQLFMVKKEKKRKQRY